MKIYTKTGDSGETALYGNTRVSKADARVDAYGEVDETNACLGASRAAGVDDEMAGRDGRRVFQIQRYRARLARLDVQNAQLVERLVKDVARVTLPARRMRAL